MKNKTTIQIGLVVYIVDAESIRIRCGYIEFFIMFHNNEAAKRRFSQISTALRSKSSIEMYLFEKWCIIEPIDYVLGWKSETTIHCSIKIKMPR